MMLSKITFTLLATVLGVGATGINCNGSGLCTGNKGILGEAQGQLRAMDKGKTFTDGQHITCVKSTLSIGNPSLCLFYQKTGGRHFTVAQTVHYVQQLLDHKCGACGSVPVDAGNDVNRGELTANMVTNAHSRQGLVAAALSERSHATDLEDKQTSEIAEPTKAEILLARALGINCRGSSTCSIGGAAHLPAGTLEAVRDAVAAGPEGQWSNNQHLACVNHVTGRLCAFYQNIGSRTFNKGQSVSYLDRLRQHGCRVCGSIPTDAGNNGANGELTVNFVA